jgi:hypothetical protein
MYDIIFYDGEVGTGLCLECTSLMMMMMMMVVVVVV